MMRHASFRTAAAVGLVLGFLPAVAAGQATSKSAAIAKELVQVMDQKKLDSIAAQATVRRALRGGAVLPERAASRHLRPVLRPPADGAPPGGEAVPRHVHGAQRNRCTPDTKIFVQDMGEPGLSSRKQDNMYDTWTQAGKLVMFDGDPEKQKMSDADYQKSFAAADEEYARILSALLAEAKK